MTIRKATEADIEEIGALISALATYEKLEHEIEWKIDDLAPQLFGDNPVVSIDLAVDDATGLTAGMALWYQTYSTFTNKKGIWLEDLFVREEFRGLGYGLALLNHLRSLTDGRVEWSVLDWNEPSIRFYESLGARPVDGWTRFRWTN